MTAEDLRTQLEDDRTTRLQEMRRLQNLMADMDEPAREDFRRPLVVMMYAHFEGFCKLALSSYVVAINSLVLKASLARPEIIAASWYRRFTRLENPSLKCDVFRQTLPDDTQLHRFARRRDFVTELPGFMEDTITVPDEVVDAESNLTPTILRKNLFRLGLDYSSVDAFEGQINELINRRNGIAHGFDRKGVTAVVFKRVEDAALRVMEHLMLLVVEAIAQKRYRRGAG